jgi:hypothetical protein
MHKNPRRLPAALTSKAALAQVMGELLDIKTISSLLFTASVSIADAGVSQQIGYLALCLEDHVEAAELIAARATQ